MTECEMKNQGKRMTHIEAEEERNAQRIGRKMIMENELFSILAYRVALLDDDRPEVARQEELLKQQPVEKLIQQLTQVVGDFAAIVRLFPSSAVDSRLQEPDMRLVLAFVNQSPAINDVPDDAEQPVELTRGIVAALKIPASELVVQITTLSVLYSDTIKANFPAQAEELRQLYKSDSHQRDLHNLPDDPDDDPPDGDNRAEK